MGGGGGGTGWQGKKKFPACRMRGLFGCFLFPFKTPCKDRCIQGVSVQQFFYPNGAGSSGTTQKKCGVKAGGNVAVRFHARSLNRLLLCLLGGPLAIHFPDTKKMPPARPSSPPGGLGVPQTGEKSLWHCAREGPLGFPQAKLGPAAVHPPGEGGTATTTTNP